MWSLFRRSVLQTLFSVLFHQSRFVADSASRIRSKPNVIQQAGVCVDEPTCGIDGKQSNQPTVAVHSEHGKNGAIKFLS